MSTIYSAEIKPGLESSRVALQTLSEQTQSMFCLMLSNKQTSQQKRTWLRTVYIYLTFYSLRVLPHTQSLGFSQPGLVSIVLFYLEYSGSQGFF